MFKIICDVCSEEIKDMNFLFEATIMEMIDTYNVTDKNLNPQKRMNKKQVQVCKACYEKNIKSVLKI